MATFAEKLYQLVSGPDNFIKFTQAGDSFVFDVDNFCDYLKHDNEFCKSKNLNSFIRQLNLYNFKCVITLDGKHRKRKRAESSKEYCNTHFKRNRPDLLGKITRNGKDYKPSARKSKRRVFARTSAPQATHSTSQSVQSPSSLRVKEEQNVVCQRSALAVYDPAAVKVKQEKIDVYQESVAVTRSSSKRKSDEASVSDSYEKPTTHGIVNSSVEDLEEINEEFKEVIDHLPLPFRTRGKKNELAGIWNVQKNERKKYCHQASDINRRKRDLSDKKFLEPSSKLDDLKIHPLQFQKHVSGIKIPADAFSKHVEVKMDSHKYQKRDLPDSKLSRPSPSSGDELKSQTLECQVVDITDSKVPTASLKVAECKKEPIASQASDFTEKKLPSAVAPTLVEVEKKQISSQKIAYTETNVTAVYSSNVEAKKNPLVFQVIDLTHNRAAATSKSCIDAKMEAKSILEVRDPEKKGISSNIVQVITEAIPYKTENIKEIESEVSYISNSSLLRNMKFKNFQSDFQVKQITSSKLNAPENSQPFPNVVQMQKMPFGFKVVQKTRYIKSKRKKIDNYDSASVCDDLNVGREDIVVSCDESNMQVSNSGNEDKNSEIAIKAAKDNINTGSVEKDIPVNKEEEDTTPPPWEFKAFSYFYLLEKLEEKFRLTPRKKISDDPVVAKFYSKWLRDFYDDDDDCKWMKESSPSVWLNVPGDDSPGNRDDLLVKFTWTC